MSAVRVIDLRGQAHALSRREWAPGFTRSADEQRGVCMHSWGTKVGTTATNRRRFGSEVEALAQRCLAVPYHISVGVTSRDEPFVVLAHPVERYTMHGDAANRHYVGIGVMGRLPAYEYSRTATHTVVTDALRAAADAALHIAAVEYLGGREGLDFIAHRNACNQSSDHFACCTEAVVAMVCGSSAVADGLFIPRPDLKLHPIARTWKPDWRRHIRERNGAPPAPPAMAEADDAPMVERFG